MKIALIGATGSVGSRIAAEALSRGHSVTGLVRHPEKAKPMAGLELKAADLGKPEALAKLLQGNDVVVSSARFLDFDAQQLLAAVRASGVKRLVVVGGAGSLKVSSGLLVDTPSFPAAYKPEAQAGARVLEALRGVQDVDWTFISPSALFLPGERTGRFRLGQDELLVDAQGNSHVSQEDYAIALVDELESHAHPRQRFTVGY